MPASWLAQLAEYVINSLLAIQTTKHKINVEQQLLAYAIAKMDGVAGYSGWRWIFIIEGLVTVVAAVISKFLIVDWPEKSRFLNDQERALLLARLESDRGEARMDRLDRAARGRVIRDIKIYLGYVFSCDDFSWVWPLTHLVR